MITQIAASKAQSLFTALTNNYVRVLYPDLDLTDDELVKKIQYVLQNRTVMYLANKLNINYKVLLHINKIADNNLTGKIIEALIDKDCTPESIRFWWKFAGGQAWSFAHRDAIKQREKDDKIALVVHDDTTNKFMNITNTGVEYVESSVDAIAFDVNITGFTKQKLTTLAELITENNVRVFEISRSALSANNINNSGLFF